MASKIYFIISIIWLSYTIIKSIKYNIKFKFNSISYINWIFINILIFLTGNSASSKKSFFYPFEYDIIDYYDSSELFFYSLFPPLIYHIVLMVNKYVFWNFSNILKSLLLQARLFLSKILNSKFFKFAIFIYVPLTVILVILFFNFEKIQNTLSQSLITPISRMLQHNIIKPKSDTTHKVLTKEYLESKSTYVLTLIQIDEILELKLSTKILKTNYNSLIKAINQNLASKIIIFDKSNIPIIDFHTNKYVSNIEYDNNEIHIEVAIKYQLKKSKLKEVKYFDIEFSKINFNIFLPDTSDNYINSLKNIFLLSNNSNGANKFEAIPIITYYTRKNSLNFLEKPYTINSSKQFTSLFELLNYLYLEIIFNKLTTRPKTLFNPETGHSIAVKSESWKFDEIDNVKYLEVPNEINLNSNKILTDFKSLPRILYNEKQPMQPSLYKEFIISYDQNNNAYEEKLTPTKKKELEMVYDENFKYRNLLYKIDFDNDGILEYIYRISAYEGAHFEIYKFNIENNDNEWILIWEGGGFGH